jgi:FRG domain
MQKQQRRLGQMSIAGQWITKYTGSNSGLFIAEFDEVGGHYEGTICVWDSKSENPNSWVYISTESNSFPQHLRGLGTTHFDNLGVALFPSTVQKLKENGIVLPETVDCTLDMKGDDLHVIWRTSIGTTGSATAPKTKAKRDSELKSLSISTWEEFKDFVNTLDRTRYIFRGQGYNKWRLCTSYHRTRRASLHRYSALDLNELHVILSAQTTMFDFNNPLQFAAFLNLAQHHGYPTPLLDWTRSPYVAAFFAFRALPKTPKYSSLRKARIFKLDIIEWNKLARADKIFPMTPNMTILSTLSAWNQRAVPQQALSTFTNVADLEAHIQSTESINQKTYLEVIDLPIASRNMIMDELALMNITAGSLFPGLDGACESLKKKNF